MVEFKNGQFINTNSFGWYPADTYEDSIQNANQLMRCVEEISSNDGSKTVVKDFYVPKISNDIDINDEQLKPYFEEGSFWDLSGHKWKDYMLLNELKYQNDNIKRVNISSPDCFNQETPNHYARFT